MPLNKYRDKSIVHLGTVYQPTKIRLLDSYRFNLTPKGLQFIHF